MVPLLDISLVNADRVDPQATRLGRRPQLHQGQVKVSRYAKSFLIDDYFVSLL